MNLHSSTTLRLRAERERAPGNRSTGDRPARLGWAVLVIIGVLVVSITAALAGSWWAERAAPAIDSGPPDQPAVVLPTAAEVPVLAAEMATRQFVARVASGDLRGSLDLVAPAAKADQAWVARLAALRPHVLRIAQLPGPASQPAPIQTSLLVWVRYRPLGGAMGDDTGALFVDLEWTSGPPGSWRVQAVTGPVQPPGGYATLPIALYSGIGTPFTRQVGPAVLWSPLRPEDALLDTMIRLEARQRGRLQTAMVLDLASPADWDRFANANGWKGPVWRAKQRLDRVPVPQVQPYYGAVGVLVDRAGRVVASLGALDPARYGLLSNRADEVADQVLVAYGLVP